MEKQERQMAEIRHLLEELSSIQRKAGILQGEERAQVVREWQEVSETLDKRLQAARYFKRNSYLFIKYLSIQSVEVVVVGESIRQEPFNGSWMDIVAGSSIVEEFEYVDQYDDVREKGGVVR